MSLENKIEILTQAVNDLTNKLVQLSANLTQPVAKETAPIVPPVPPVPPAPVVPPVSAAPVMPAPPVFTAPVIPPVPVVSKTVAPFTNGKELIDYAMASYVALGAEKGALIQNVITSLGYETINEIRPEHYNELYAGIEALKK